MNPLTSTATRFFDHVGRKLRFLGKTEPRGRFIKRASAVGPVTLIADEAEPHHQEQLRQLLIRCLGAVDPTHKETDSASLAELVTEATQRFRYP